MSIEEGVPVKPDWLDDKFIKLCIKNDKGVSEDEIVINDSTLHYAIPKGENFTSLILRLTINADFSEATPKLNGHSVNGTNGKELTMNGTNGTNGHKDISYVIKALIEQNLFTDYLNSLQVLPKEIDMYTNFIPKLHALLKKAGLETTFICRCLHYDEKNLLIVMEDLNKKGYQVANRILGTDLDHTKIVMRKIATLHAASMKYYEQNTYKDAPAYYYKGLVHHIEDNKLRASLQEMFGRTSFTKKIKALAETLSNKPGYEREAKIMTSLIDYGYDILCDVSKYKPGNIMNGHLHGDCWINNMMFKYDAYGKPLDVLLVDMQISYIGTITNEFFYFFMSSASDEVREFHYDEIVNFYHRALVETLKIVGYKGVIPSLKQLKEELLVSSSLFLLVTTYLLQIVKSQIKEAENRSEEEVASFENVTKTPHQEDTNPVLEKALFSSVNLLRKIGSFDYHEQLLQSYKK